MPPSNEEKKKTTKKSSTHWRLMQFQTEKNERNCGLGRLEQMTNDDIANSFFKQLNWRLNFILFIYLNMGKGCISDFVVVEHILIVILYD